MTQDIYGQLREAVQRVAQARTTEAAWKDMLRQKNAAFDAENAELIAVTNGSSADTAKAEALARQLVAAHFLVTGEKKPVAGVEVKERTKRTITDRAAALAWARAPGLALIPEDVDDKAVLKIASVTTEPQVNIDSILPTED